MFVLLGILLLAVCIIWFLNIAFGNVQTCPGCNYCAPDQCKGPWSSGAIKTEAGPY